VQVRIDHGQVKSLQDGSVTCGIKVYASADFGDVAWLVDCPHGIAIYAGSTFESAGGVVLPAWIDWQLLRGSGSGCRETLWETVPVAQGSTFLPAGSLVGNSIALEGLLWQVDGALADNWLLRARMTGAPGPTNLLRTSLRVVPGSPSWGSGLQVQAGSIVK
jgi:hypothetical protein